MSTSAPAMDAAVADITAAVSEATFSRIQQLRCDISEKTAVLRGHAATFYLKQLANFAGLATAAKHGLHLRNEIEVHYHPRPR